MTIDYLVCLCSTVFSIAVELSPSASLTSPFPMITAITNTILRHTLHTNTGIFSSSMYQPSTRLSKISVAKDVALCGGGGETHSVQSGNARKCVGVSVGLPGPVRSTRAVVSSCAEGAKKRKKTEEEEGKRKELEEEDVVIDDEDLALDDDLTSAMVEVRDEGFVSDVDVER
ncbi:hypothetical protein ONZ45_g7818 [Pleurotus djamor]|nr:hypothetical protein ONZ45_g7818 [Pleurotus djamor]